MQCIGALKEPIDDRQHYARGAVVELIDEVKLLYSFGLQLRGGVAKGLDEPRDVLGYLSLGRAF